MSKPTIKLIGTSASRVMRNIWMLTELRLPYDHDPIVTSDPALKQPPYTEWNPNAKVPICIVDGFAIYESLAINLYLDMKFPSAISLNTIEEKAQGIQWGCGLLRKLSCTASTGISTPSASQRLIDTTHSRLRRGRKCKGRWPCWKKR